jgi:hypothetical protein
MRERGAQLRSLVVLSASLLALTLAACGGGGSSTSSPPPSSTPATTQASGSPPSKARSETGAKPGYPKQGQGAKGSALTEDSTGPLKVSGGGSAQFKVSGGDNSIQEYGSEAGASELRQAAAAVHAFYAARVSEEWARACSYLAKSTAAGLRQLSASSPRLRGKGCAGALDALTKPLSPSLQRETTTVDAAALRHEGEQAFLIYTAPPGKTVYAMPLRLEGGEWKLGALAGAELPGT